jgi:hypothetical protein
MMSYDHAKACAVVEAPNVNTVNAANHGPDPDDDAADHVAAESSPKGNQYSSSINNNYADKGELWCLPCTAYMCRYRHRFF